MTDSICLLSAFIYVAAINLCPHHSLIYFITHIPNIGRFSVTTFMHVSFKLFSSPEFGILRVRKDLVDITIQHDLICCISYLKVDECVNILLKLKNNISSYLSKMLFYLQS